MDGQKRGRRARQASLAGGIVGLMLLGFTGTGHAQPEAPSNGQFERDGVAVYSAAAFSSDKTTVQTQELAYIDLHCRRGDFYKMSDLTGTVHGWVATDDVYTLGYVGSCWWWD